MAKPLNERIESARSTDRINITDLEALVAEAIVERDRQVGARDHHAEEAVNLALSDDDREESDRLAQHCGRLAKAYTVAIDELQEKLEAKRNSEYRKAAEAEAAARMAFRDDLAARVADRVPKIFDELIGLLAELEAHPEAEAIARGVPANFYIGSVPVTQLVKMKIPKFEGHGLAWPIDKAAAGFARMNEHSRQQWAQYEEEKRTEHGRWARYMVEGPMDGTQTMVETRRGYAPMGRGHVCEAEMTVQGVEDAKRNGCTVTPLKPNETVGLPTDMAIV